MTKKRISLAELARLASARQAEAEEAGAPQRPLPLTGFDVSDSSQAGHPTVADLSECLFFSPGDGRIWLQDQRMLLLHSDALGSLRRELIDSIGLDQARGLLTRAGYVSGARDAQMVRQQWPDADPTSTALAGTRLHALEGSVRVELVHASYDAVSGAYDGEFLWHNSIEDDEHIAAYGVGGSPACWMQVGYATGYVSTLFGRLVVFREVSCRSSGDALCRVIGKSAELWDDVQQDLRYLNVQSFVGSTASAPGPAPIADLEAFAAANPGSDPTMVGASSSFNAACHMLRRVAPTTATVLFTGESGVGKEMFASTLHRISPRAEQPFVAINCAAIPETLMESELFGVERGAYTGAGTSRAGRFERANGGTLFLDEVGTLSFVAQGKLLRALQEGEVERVGGSKTIPVDVRVIAATNVDLRQAVREGHFREDLFFRLNVFPIHLPPLRDRRDDIPLLMSHFLAHYNRRHRRNVAGFSQSALKAMYNYAFPGNIRELQNLVERGVILVGDGEAIEVHHLFSSGESLAQDVLSLAWREDGPTTLNLRGAGRAPDEPTAPVTAPGGTLEQAELALLRQAIRRSGGNLSAAARDLGVSRATVAYRAKKFGLAV